MNTIYPSIRNREKLSIEGYSYVFDKMSASSTIKFWRCDNRSTCKARVHTDLQNVVLKHINIHSHDSDPAKIIIKEKMNIAKASAILSTDPPSVIFSTTLTNTGVAVRGKMPKKSAFNKMIQRSRITIEQSPTLPLSLQALVIPDNYKSYECLPGVLENFLLYDSHDDTCRFLIFGRESISSWINLAYQVFVDGTFSISPPLFDQVFVILAKRSGFVFPILYCLLPNKKEQTYTRMFRAVVQLFPRFSPSSFSCDFEMGVMNSIRTIFPASHINGCFFHLAKNMRKCLSKNNLLQFYNNDPDFALCARMIISIAFVPPQNIAADFNVLIQNSPNVLVPVLNWFEDNYIGRLNLDGSRRSPLFPNPTWSLYDRTLEKLDRTNNYAEAAHRRLQIQFSCDHPTIWKFIDSLRSFQSHTDQIYAEFIRGDLPVQKRTKYRQIDTRILRIVESYGERNIMEYLRGLATNFLMQ